MTERDVRGISEWAGCTVTELNVQVDHVHVVVSISPKVSVSEPMETMKGKTAIILLRVTRRCVKSLTKETASWALGYFGGTVEVDEDTVRKYVRYQEKEEPRLWRLAPRNAETSTSCLFPRNHARQVLSCLAGVHRGRQSRNPDIHCRRRRCGNSQNKSR